MRSARAVIKRTLVSFYDDQMTHHAAALTYYSLMSLFPATLLGLSLLGLLGQYPSTYAAIIDYLRGVVPHTALVPLDSSLRQALQHKGTAVTAFVISIVTASAPGQRATLQIDAAVGPRPIKPKTSEAN